MCILCRGIYIYNKCTKYRGGGGGGRERERERERERACGIVCVVDKERSSVIASRALVVVLS